MSFFLKVFFQFYLYRDRFSLLNMQYCKSELNQKSTIFNYTHMIVIISSFIKIKNNILFPSSEKKSKRKLLCRYKELAISFDYYHNKKDGEMQQFLYRGNIYNFFIFYHKYFYLKKSLFLLFSENLHSDSLLNITVYDTWRVNIFSVLSYTKLLEEEENWMYHWNRYVF
nr:hypothetical protein [Madagascaria erythrocladioides]